MNNQNKALLLIGIVAVSVFSYAMLFSGNGVFTSQSPLTLMSVPLETVLSAVDYKLNLATIKTSFKGCSLTTDTKDYRSYDELFKKDVYDTKNIELNYQTILVSKNNEVLGPNNVNLKKATYSLYYTTDGKTWNKLVGYSGDSVTYHNFPYGTISIAKSVGYGGGEYIDEKVILIEDVPFYYKDYIGRTQVRLPSDKFIYPQTFIIEFEGTSVDVIGVKVELNVFVQWDYIVSNSKWVTIATDYAYVANPNVFAKETVETNPTRSETDGTRNLQIFVTPTDAFVTLMKLGTVVDTKKADGYTGAYFANLQAGSSYSVYIDFGVNYKPIRYTKIQIPGDNILYFTLEKIGRYDDPTVVAQDLVITSKPTGSRVSIDEGRYTGITPCTIQVERGYHFISIYPHRNIEGEYASIENERFYMSDTKTTLHYDLKPRGDLTIKTGVPEAFVQLNVRRETGSKYPVWVFVIADYEGNALFGENEGIFSGVRVNKILISGGVNPYTKTQYSGGWSYPTMTNILVGKDTVIDMPGTWIGKKYDKITVTLETPSKAQLILKLQNINASYTQIIETQPGQYYAVFEDIPYFDTYFFSAEVVGNYAHISLTHIADKTHQYFPVPISFPDDMHIKLQMSIRFTPDIKKYSIKVNTNGIPAEVSTVFEYELSKGRKMYVVDKIADFTGLFYEISDLMAKQVVSGITYTGQYLLEVKAEGHHTQYIPVILTNQDATLNIYLVSDKPLPPPVISLLELPKQYNVGENILFNTATTYENPEQLLYKWDFGDGTKYGNWLYKPQVVHKYEYAGTYTVTVIAFNGETESQPQSMRIQIQSGQAMLPLIDATNTLVGTETTATITFKSEAKTDTYMLKAYVKDAKGNMIIPRWTSVQDIYTDGTHIAQIKFTPTIEGPVEIGAKAESFDIAYKDSDYVLYNITAFSTDEAKTQAEVTEETTEVTPMEFELDEYTSAMTIGMIGIAAIMAVIAITIIILYVTRKRKR
jgi:PKD repeat protein